MEDSQYYNLIDQIRKISLEYKQVISETNNIIYSQIREYNFFQLKLNFLKQ